MSTIVFGLEEGRLAITDIYTCTKGYNAVHILIFAIGFHNLSCETLKGGFLEEFESFCSV